MAKKPHAADAAIAAALALAAERGWRSLSMADIAGQAGMPLAELIERFPNRRSLLGAYVESVDSRMLAGGAVAGENARDRLFDVAMRRFEAMAPDRAALGAILRQSGGDPCALACGARRFLRSMALTLEASGLSAAGLSGMARVQGLAAAYLYALRTFLGDDTPDLSRTMAALDRALRRAEGIALLVWGRHRPHPPPHAEGA